MLQSEQLLDAEAFTVERLTVRTQNGKTVRRHVVRHPGSVAIVAENALREVALVRVFRPALGRYQWELPAGRLDPGQDVATVAVEELRSEVGVEAAEIEVACQVLTSPGHSDHRTTIVRMRQLRSAEVSARTDDESSLRIAWLPVDKAFVLARADGPTDAKTLIGLNLIRSAGYGTESLVGLLSTTNDRFIADNATIWTTGAIFVPAAYALPAIYFSLSRQTWAALFVLMTVSIALTTAWLFIGEVARAFQNSPEDQAKWLRSTIGLPELRKRSDLRWGSRLIERVRIGTLRRLLAFGVPAIWVAMAIGKAIS